jgi:hypothetical protein
MNGNKGGPRLRLPIEQIKGEKIYAWGLPAQREAIGITVAKQRSVFACAIVDVNMPLKLGGQAFTGEEIY